MTKILALLTGRSGSKYKNKNIKKLRGKPVLYYPAIAAKKIKNIDYFYVSSDDNQILNTANKFGFKKIKRPKKLSRANSLHGDVIIHSLEHLKKQNIYPNIIVVLLANAPIIKKEWIESCIKILQKKNATAVVPVNQDNDKHPFRSKKLNKDYLVPYFKFKKKLSSNRQDLQKSFFLCHNFWVIKTDSIYKKNGHPPWDFMGKKVIPFEVSKTHDIHDDLDFEICKILLKKK